MMGGCGRDEDLMEFLEQIVVPGTNSIIGSNINSVAEG